MRGIANRLTPLCAKLLKGKQGSTYPDCDLVKRHLNYFMQFLVCCGLAACNLAISFLNLSNLTPTHLDWLTFWDETHYRVTISGKGTKKNKICFKHNDTSTLDNTVMCTSLLSLLWMRHAKEAQFLSSVAIIKQGSNDISTQLLLLNCAEKVVHVPE